MSISRDEFAAMLDGREYREEMSRADAALARESRLLVIYGASDDLTEFEGILNDEAGAYDGAEHVIYRSNDRWILIHDDEAPRADGGIPVLAEWCPEGFDGSFRISSPIPHATFKIMEDDNLYCVGIVIDERDMLTALNPD